MRRLLDAYGGVVQTFEYDDLTGQALIKKTQETDPIVRHNAMLREQDPYMVDGSVRRVANVPRVVLEEWCREAGITVRDFLKNRREYMPWLRKKLYDRDNEMFLTAPHFRGSKKSTRILGLDEALQR